MKIRKLTLEEWFLGYQLKKVDRNYSHVNITFDVDVTDLSNHFSRRNEKFPLAEILIKTMGYVLERHPELNRIKFNTLFGQRLAFLDSIGVNLPISVRGESQRHVTVMTVKDSHKKTLAQIRDEIRQEKKKGVGGHPLLNFLVSRSNSFWNRWILIGGYWLLSRSPKTYAKMGGGAISLSLLTNVLSEQLRFSYFPQSATPLTFGVAALDSKNGRAILNLGVGFEHSTLQGEYCAQSAVTIAEILANPEYILDAKDLDQESEKVSRRPEPTDTRI